MAGRSSVAAIALTAMVATGGAVASAADTASQDVAPPIVHKVTQQEGEAAQYWTPERMHAVSAADANPTQQKRQPLAFNAVNSTAPTDSWHASASPYNPIHGKIFFTRDGGDYGCSGTAVASANSSTVWTAAHCLIGDKPGQAVTNVVFVPQYNTNNTADRPYGTWEMHSYSVPNEFSQAPHDSDGYYSRRSDYAAFAVRRNAQGQRMLEKFNGAPMAFGQSLDRAITAYGYPVTSVADGHHLFECSGTSSVFDGFAGVPCPGGGGGQSGGGWLSNINGQWTVVGNNEGINGSNIVGPILGDDAQAVYNAVQHINT
ncbi:hypothetical protein ABT117_39050 [Streptomyces sp. NPDC002262]|uniref:trypsin-like serine peptidase n=1 Tax=Streptomyces sp. NPDC002262 TaxID=3154414 RepID=UPI0033257BA9